MRSRASKVVRYKLQPHHAANFLAEKVIRGEVKGVQKGPNQNKGNVGSEYY
jgi:hypothetical protein